MPFFAGCTERPHGQADITRQNWLADKLSRVPFPRERWSRVAGHHTDVQQVSGTQFNALEYDDAIDSGVQALLRRDTIFAGVGAPSRRFST